MNLSFALLADKADIWRELGSGFQGEKSGLSFNDVMLLVSVIALVCMSFWMLARVMAKQDRKQGFNNPKELFKSLCQAHGLSRGEQSLLKQLARQKQLELPARVFLEPGMFQPDNLPTDLKAQAARYQSLGKRLFAVPVAEPVALTVEATTPAAVNS